MGTPSLVLRIIVIILSAVIIFLPWMWTECILGMPSLSAMGLGIVCVTVAASLIAIEDGEQLHCEIIEGILGCLLIISGILQVKYDNNDCNIVVFLILLVVAGVLFLTDMILVILGKN